MGVGPRIGAARALIINNHRESKPVLGLRPLICYTLRSLVSIVPKMGPKIFHTRFSNRVYGFTP